MSDALEAYFGNGENILIVDDVEEQRDIATDMLTLLNYKPHSVSSGEAAVTFLRHHHFDLILLDMIMDPGWGGLHTYQEIVRIHPDQRALLVSGFSKTDDVRRAQKIGAGRYLKKPYTLEDLARAVKGELNG
ncbi:MAG: response regulator [Desulfobacteraceae bacterium]